MCASAFVQYDSTAKTVVANVRFRREYRPGSERFVELNEECDTPAPHFPEPRNRSLIFKINRLFRF